MRTHSGETLVLGRNRLLLVTYGECTFWYGRPFVGHDLRWRGLVLVAAHIFRSLSVRVLVCAVGAVAESASTRRRASGFAVIHVALVFAATGLPSPGVVG
jgi:hypothetical protein